MADGWVIPQFTQNGIKRRGGNGSLRHAMIFADRTIMRYRTKAALVSAKSDLEGGK
jgi:hypothetical protein